MNDMRRYTNLRCNEEPAHVGRRGAACVHDALCGRQRGLVGTPVNVELSQDRQRTVQKGTCENVSFIHSLYSQ